MRKTSCLFFFVFMSAILLHCQIRAESNQREEMGPDVRRPILAGTWYPADRIKLHETIQDVLDSVNPARPTGKITAVIVPHAGYMYSGRVAAHAYKLIAHEDFNRVIMIGPSHRYGFKGISVNLQSGYQTPLGTVKVDEVLARKLIAAGPDIKWIPRAHALEHSLEIQLPFLQTVLKDFKIIPIIMGQQDLRTCAELASILAKVIERPDRTLLLASTDLSHFHNYGRAMKLDAVFTEYVKTNDPQGLSRALASGQCEACGGGPAVTVMMTANHLKAARAVILEYANSGDVTGDKQRVVGYLSAALIRIKEDK
jgi:AmmeMemoRadiSam system protein B